METHRPEHGETVRVYDTPHGKRIEVRFPSNSKPGTFHFFHVNLDGTRAVCDCAAFKVAKSCYLTKHAEEVVQAHWYRLYDLLDPGDMWPHDRRLLALAGKWTPAERIEFAGLGDAIAGSFGTLEEHDPYIYGPEGVPPDVAARRQWVQDAVRRSESEG